MKKNKMKRLFAVLMAMILTVSLVVATPVVVAGEEWDDFEFEIIDEVNVVVGEATPAAPFIIEDYEMDRWLNAVMIIRMPYPPIERERELTIAVHWRGRGCPILNNVQATPVGTYLGWCSYTIYPHGYRIFRSLAPIGDGLSITDFPIASGTRFAFDANATNLPGFEIGMPIYYRIEAVLEEARLEICPDTRDPILIPEVLTNNFRWIRVYVDCNEDPRTRGSVIMQIGSNKMQVDDAGRRGYASPRTVEMYDTPPPFIEAGRTMLPVRAMSDGIDAEIGWDGADSRIDLTALGLDGRMNNASMWIGRFDALVNNGILMMDVAPNTWDGRTFIPVRYAAEFLGSEIAWIGSLQKVVIVFLLP